MNKQDWKLWNKLTFKTLSYRKNFDMIDNNENYITEYEGLITKLMINERKPPYVVGEYGFSVWNINMGVKYNTDFRELLLKHEFEDTYSELISAIDNDGINIYDYDKIILIHNVTIAKDFRKRGVVEELTEMFYRDFYGEKIAIIVLAKPFQNNKIDLDFFSKHKYVSVKESLNILEAQKVPSMKYYSLDELMEKDDVEKNEYKLFAVASKCGFQRIGDSYLFLLSPEKVIERFEKKQKMIQPINDEEDNFLY